MQDIISSVSNLASRLLGALPLFGPPDVAVEARRLLVDIEHLRRTPRESMKIDAKTMKDRWENMKK